MENVPQHGCSPGTQSSIVGKNSRNERVVIVRSCRRGRKDMQFLEDTALHLLCRLIGECHREYMPIGVSVLILKKKTYICLCKVIGLT